MVDQKSHTMNDDTAEMSRLLARFEPISLAEMERVSLLNRKDSANRPCASRSGNSQTALLPARFWK